MRQCFVMLLVIGIVSVANAGERRFTYTYEPEVLPVGVRELEIWSTYQWKNSGSTIRLDNRVEFEVGLGGRLQTSFYLDVFSRSDDSERRTTVGIANAWVYQFWDMADRGVGLALYGEWLLQPAQFALEFKVLGQFAIGEMLIAWNLIGEREWERERSEWETIDVAAVTAGVSLPIARSIAGGIEVVQKNYFGDGKWKSAALSAGPVISVRQSGWWSTLTILPRLVDFWQDSSPLQWQVRWLFSWIL